MMIDERRLLSVDEAMAKMLASVTPLAAIDMELATAAGLILAQDYRATRNNPVDAVSAMDGYAVNADDIAAPGTELKIVAEIAAGSVDLPVLRSGQAARIFTGAAMPSGANAVLIQENASLAPDGSAIIAQQKVSEGLYVRRKGRDFTTGQTLLKAGDRLDPYRLALAAAMDYASVKVIAKPKVAIIASGDELRLPEISSVTIPDIHQPAAGVDAKTVISSNSFAIAALVNEFGGCPHDYGIVYDRLTALKQTIGAAISAGDEVIVISGGASVGDYDFTGTALSDLGFVTGFWRIAMKPGKPLLYGYRDDDNRRIYAVGLPGNPVSSIVCSLIFLRPLIRKLTGYNAASWHLPQMSAMVKGRCQPTGKRQEYLRATLAHNSKGEVIATPFPDQDSSLLSVMAAADALIIRPAMSKAIENDPARIIILPGKIS